MAIFSLIRLQADYILVVGVCLTLSVANIVGFTKCQKGMFLKLYLIFQNNIYWFKVGSIAGNNEIFSVPSEYLLAPTFLHACSIN